MILTRDEVRLRLEEAGATLLALPGTASPQKFRSNMPPIVQEAITAYGYTGAKMRPAIPSAERISRMDEALAWVSLIPSARGEAGGGATLRRLIHLRLLVDPLSWSQSPEKPKYLFTWRMLSYRMGADHRSIKVWHGAALGLITDTLAARMVAQH